MATFFFLETKKMSCKQHKWLVVLKHRKTGTERTVIGKGKTPTNMTRRRGYSGKNWYFIKRQKIS